MWTIRDFWWYLKNTCASLVCSIGYFLKPRLSAVLSFSWRCAQSSPPQTPWNVTCDGVLNPQNTICNIRLAPRGINENPLKHKRSRNLTKDWYDWLLRMRTLGVGYMCRCDTPAMAGLSIIFYSRTSLSVSNDCLWVVCSSKANQCMKITVLVFRFVKWLCSWVLRKTRIPGLGNSGQSCHRELVGCVRGCVTSVLLIFGGDMWMLKLVKREKRLLDLSI